MSLIDIYKCPCCGGELKSCPTCGQLYCPDCTEKMAEINANRIDEDKGPQ